MSISDYAEVKILDHLTGRASWTAPTSVFLRLHTNDPGEDGLGNNAANSVRQPVTFSAASLGAGTIASNAVITWTNVSNTETYRWWSLWDANGNTVVGNCLWKGSLSTEASVTAGDTFQISTLTLTLS